MKKISAIFATLALIGASAPVFADEVGPAYPLSASATTTTSSDETGGGMTDEAGTGAEEVGLMEYLVLLFD